MHVMPSARIFAPFVTVKLGPCTIVAVLQCLQRGHLLVCKTREMRSDQAMGHAESGAVLKKCAAVKVGTRAAGMLVVSEGNSLRTPRA